MNIVKKRIFENLYIIIGNLFFFFYHTAKDNFNLPYAGG